MQPGNEQGPQGSYFRPDLEPGMTPGKHDKTVGIIIMVLSALGLCCGIAGAVGVGALSALGASAAAASGSRSDAAALGAVGAMAGVTLVFSIILSAASAYVGYLIMNSKPTGFKIGFILGIIGAVYNLLNFPVGLLGVIFNGALAYYCWGRQNGKIQ